MNWKNQFMSFFIYIYIYVTVSNAIWTTFHLKTVHFIGTFIMISIHTLICLCDHMFICTHMYIHINTYTNIFRELKKTSPHISGIQRYPHFQFLIYKPNTYTNSHYLSTIHIKSTSYSHYQWIATETINW